MRWNIKKDHVRSTPSVTRCQRTICFLKDIICFFLAHPFSCAGRRRRFFCRPSIGEKGPTGLSKSLDHEASFRNPYLSRVTFLLGPCFGNHFKKTVFRCSPYVIHAHYYPTF